MSNNNTLVGQQAIDSLRKSLKSRSAIGGRWDQIGVASRRKLATFVGVTENSGGWVWASFSDDERETIETRLQMVRALLLKVLP